MKRPVGRARNKRTGEKQFFIPPLGYTARLEVTFRPKKEGFIIDVNGVVFATADADCGGVVVVQPPTNVVPGRPASVRDIRITRSTGWMAVWMDPLSKRMAYRLFGPAGYTARAGITDYRPTEPSAYQQLSNVATLIAGDYQLYYQPEGATDWSLKEFTLTDQYDDTIFQPEVEPSVGEVEPKLTTDRSQLNIRAQVLNPKPGTKLEVRMQGIEGTNWPNSGVFEMNAQADGLFTHSFAYPDIDDGMNLEVRVNVQGQGAFVPRFVYVRADGAAPVWQDGVKPNQIEPGQDYAWVLTPDAASGSPNYTVVSKPNWLIFDGLRGFTGTAPGLVPGDAETITLRATNAYGSADKTFTFTYGQTTELEAGARVLGQTLTVGANPDQGEPPLVQVTKLAGQYAWTQTDERTMDDFDVDIPKAFTWSRRDYNNILPGTYLIKVTFPGGIVKYAQIQVTATAQNYELTLTDTPPSSALALPGPDEVPEGGSRQFTATGGTPPYTYYLKQVVSGVSASAQGLVTVGNNTATNDTRSAILVVKDSTNATAEKSFIVRDTSVADAITKIEVRYDYDGTNADPQTGAGAIKTLLIRVTRTGSAETEVSVVTDRDPAQDPGWQNGQTPGSFWETCSAATRLGETFYGYNQTNGNSTTAYRGVVRDKATKQDLGSFSLLANTVDSAWQEIYPSASGATIVTVEDDSFNS
ncbi:hypothetical protein DYU11_20965 [Fibrisoma montanum]|uniref:Uncharacterized protein n=1 Tax=Fibrisoma montanum TaxID=2305895 RepID=A0A418M481_9BACT|nr:hypothetical protein [Fibrisoma montanum]RIV20519.1 hypothetical protein DYU11_20965 [Fibrisoma montanum]